jgi:cell division septation protein DedD
MKDDDRRQAGWVSTLVALVVLVVVGFLCGALAGFVWQEPRLVLAYLSGKTEPVKWSENEPGSVAAEPPSYSESADFPRDSRSKLDAESEIPPAPTGAPRADATELAHEKPPAAPAPAKVIEKKPPVPVHNTATRLAPAKPAVVAAVSPTGRYSVQVGAFADRAGADKLVSRLRARGYRSFVKADTEGSGKRFRVRVGPVNARERAEELAAKLAKGEKLPTWILDEGKG